MTETKTVGYIRFREAKTEEFPNRTTKTYYVETTNSPTARLGIVQFWPTWRKYVFAPAAGTVYDPQCMQALLDFCLEKTKMWQAP